MGARTKNDNNNKKPSVCNVVLFEPILATAQSSYCRNVDWTLLLCGHRMQYASIEKWLEKWAEIIFRNYLWGVRFQIDFTAIILFPHFSASSFLPKNSCVPNELEKERMTASACHSHDDFFSVRHWLHRIQINRVENVWSSCKRLISGHDSCLQVYQRKGFTQIRTRKIRVELFFFRCQLGLCAIFAVLLLRTLSVSTERVFHTIQIFIWIGRGEKEQPKRWRYNFWFTKFVEFHPCISFQAPKFIPNTKTLKSKFRSAKFIINSLSM